MKPLAKKGEIFEARHVLLLGNSFQRLATSRVEHPDTVQTKSIMIQKKFKVDQFPRNVPGKILYKSYALEGKKFMSAMEKF